MLSLGRRIIKQPFIIFNLFFWCLSNFAQAFPAQKPLYVGISAVTPNILLMIDSSGSMDSTVTTTSEIVSPNAMPLNYSFTCSTPISTSSTAIPMVINSTGAPRFCKSSSSCSSSNQTALSSKKCFSNTKTYNVAYYNGATLTGGPFTGLKLNWYFSNGSFQAGSLTATSTTTISRNDIAKQAAKDLVNSLTPDTGLGPTVRMGLARYDTDNDGGMLLSEIKDLDLTQANILLGQIDKIPTTGYTPLAETLSDIGKYFATGEISNLILHPTTTKVSETVDRVFSKSNVTTPRTINNQTGNTLVSSGPILGYCQKSYAILVSDGLPTQDTEVSPSLQNYYNGGDYLDDVAKALYEMDLRPSLDASQKASTNTKNNLVTYTIGLADTSIKNSVLTTAAKVGGGAFFFAEDSKALAAALDDTIADIASQVGSSSSVATNSSKLESGAVIYQARFDSANWTGNFTAFSLFVSEDINLNGILDVGEDLNNNGILDAGGVGTKLWEAAEHIPNYATRNIFTYNPTLTTVNKGAVFTCSELSSSQKTTLGITNCSSTSDQGVWRLNYIRGDASHELINASRKDPETIRTGSNLVFRNRTSINRVTGLTDLPDPWVLEDIVNSDPLFVSDENYGFDQLPLSEGGSYKAFVVNNKSRKKMIYVGSNGGMFHGFDPDNQGAEVLAYIPNEVYSQLYSLSTPNYAHAYSVDGSPDALDVYFDSAWHTVVVGTSGAGGKAIFALDVTDPRTFSKSNVLWELSDSYSPIVADRTEFANNFGFALPKPVIARMKNGSWVAIVANGYGSNNNLAVLYIIDIKTGALIKTFNTMAGSVTTPNGMSTPVAADTNNDKITDVIYAGDLLGNVWKFDVSSSDPSKWNIAYNNAPLFNAGTNQPITSALQVGPVGGSQASNGITSGVMVYFGTGKYYEESDNIITNAQTQSFYGLWDNNSPISKSDLQSQSIIAEVVSGSFNLRVSSDTAVNYPTKKGWYMDLPSTGERVVSEPLLRKGRIIFVTTIPIPPVGTAICGSSASSTGWLMELDALTGKRLSTTATGLGAPWDINQDGMINSSDLITITINGVVTLVAPSGKKSTVGGVDTPGVITSGQLEYKYTSGTSGQMEVTTESRGTISGSGRKSWRQIFE